MRPEFDDLLCHRYPDIFRDRHGSPQQTVMCWGFTCGDGWFEIIDRLCAEITIRVAAGQIPPVIATQVKSKAGYLRFGYVGQFAQERETELRALIIQSEDKSRQTCEECGADAGAWEPDSVCPKCGARR